MNSYFGSSDISQKLKGLLARAEIMSTLSPSAVGELTDETITIVFVEMEKVLREVIEEIDEHGDDRNLNKRMKVPA